MHDFSGLQPRPRGIDDLELDFLLGCVPQCQPQTRDVARRAPQIGDFTIDHQPVVVASRCNLSDHETGSRTVRPSCRSRRRTAPWTARSQQRDPGRRSRSERRGRIAPRGRSARSSPAPLCRADFAATAAAAVADGTERTRPGAGGEGRTSATAASFVRRSGLGRSSADRWRDARRRLTPAVAAIRTAHVPTGRPAQLLLVDAKASSAGGAGHNRHRVSARPS